MRTRTTVLTACVGLGLLGLTVLQARTPGPDRPALATRPAGTRAVAAEGRVATYPGGEVVVSADRSGRLVRLDLVEGDAVPRGAVVAEIDSAELRAALAEQQARILEAEAEQRLAEATLARRRALRDQGVATAQDVDEAERDLSAAAARAQTARAAAERAEAELAKCVVRAPIAGTLTRRHADPGERVEAGAPLVTLADLDRLRVEAEADEADAGALRLGAAAVVTADGYPGRSWAGTVEEIGDAVRSRSLRPEDPSRPTDTRVLPVKIAFAGASPLKLGTTVEVRIDTR